MLDITENLEEVETIQYAFDRYANSDVGLDLFLVWHRREHDDPAHRWLRQRIVATVNSLVEN